MNKKTALISTQNRLSKSNYPSLALANAFDTRNQLSFHLTDVENTI